MISLTKGECKRCGGPLEFERQIVGTMVNCPHCAEETPLFPARFKNSDDVTIPPPPDHLRKIDDSLAALAILLTNQAAKREEFRQALRDDIERGVAKGLWRFSIVAIGIAFLIGLIVGVAGHLK